MAVQQRSKAVEVAGPETGRIGKRGTLVIPVTMRRRLGIREGSLVIIEDREGGIFVRPAVAVPVDSYTPEREAQVLLSGATDAKDYARAVREVRKLGLDPSKIPHHRPPRV